jgi:hypothetical protein
VLSVLSVLSWRLLAVILPSPASAACQCRQAEVVISTLTATLGCCMEFVDGARARLAAGNTGGMAADPYRPDADMLPVDYLAHCVGDTILDCQDLLAMICPAVIAVQVDVQPEINDQRDV